MAQKKNAELKWDRLDNTANLFPVIASESMTSVYRLSVTLKEVIDKEILQKALDILVPQFDVFNVRLRRGMFWYYFETNRKEVPRVLEEDTYPCRYIALYDNNNYLFRVTYHRKRINLEVFHVLTDGMGAITFLRELTYHYLRMVHPELSSMAGEGLSSQTSLNREDSYLKNYKKSKQKGYKTERAFKIRGERFAPNVLGVIHGYLPIAELKTAAKARGLSLNQYLVGIYFYSIYKERLRGQPSKKPITICVPVNLRPYFDSNTTRNFFTVVTAVFKPVNEEYTLEEILEIVTKSLKEQITKDNFERLISYGVARERNIILRVVPLFLKKLAIKNIYRANAGANTTTLTNVGEIQLHKEYQEYVERFHVVLSMTQGQDIKCALCSYNNEVVLTFSSSLKDISIQKAFFRKLAEEGVNVTVETNGVYYE